MTKDFNNFLSSLKETNKTLSSLVDFAKAEHNAKRIAIKLNQLNYLLGKQDLKSAIYDLYAENPNCFDILNMLVATRDGREKVIDVDTFSPTSLNSYFKSPENIYNFCIETNLEKLFVDKKISNLYDYIFGIEVGLDTNARKNRGGKTMEAMVSSLFEQHQISFQEQVSSLELPISSLFGTDKKVFDFCIQTRNCTYLIEVNFYNSGGSKLNEVCRSYTDIDKKLKDRTDYQFVWITDGKGWLNAKNKLEEAYVQIKHVYNFYDLDKFIEHLQKERVQHLND